MSAITAKIRFTVCRCLWGAARSARRISSVIGLNWSALATGAHTSYVARGHSEASMLCRVTDVHRSRGHHGTSTRQLPARISRAPPSDPGSTVPQREPESRRLGGDRADVPGRCWNRVWQ
jgi:hypothetical protein